MLDLSEEDLHENVATCVDFFKRMNKLEMSIEIELGVTGGEEDGVDNSGVENSKLIYPARGCISCLQGIDAGWQFIYHRRCFWQCTWRI